MTETIIKKRIKYHEAHIMDIESHVKQVFEHYKTETRSGLDDFQLKDLLIWRKEEVARGKALREFHAKEIKWLKTLLQDN